MATGGGRGNFYNIDQVLLCQICLNPLVSRKARQLSCLHTFCEACLDNCLTKNQGRQITCAICRQLTELPRGLVTDLPLNFNIDQTQEMVETVIQTALCDKCCKRKEYIPSTHRCITCPRQMCDTCKKQHDKFPGFLAHQVEELTRDVPINGGHTCKTHKSPICLFCKKCKVLLCTKCTAEDTHDSHTDDIQSLDDAMSDTKKLLLDKKNVVARHMDCVREKIDVNTKQLEHIASAEKDITDAADSLKSRIDKSVEDLLNDLKENYKTKIKEQKTALTDVLGRCTSCLKVLEEFEGNKTAQVLERREAWTQDTSELEQLMSKLKTEEDIPMVKFKERLQVFRLDETEFRLPMPRRRRLLTQKDLRNLSVDMCNMNAGKPTLIKSFTKLPVNEYFSVIALTDGSALFLGESGEEILRTNHMGDILSKYKHDSPGKLVSMSACDKKIVCTFDKKETYLELNLEGNQISFVKLHVTPGIKADGVCVDCSGNIILYDEKTVTKLDSRDNIVWQKTVRERCDPIKSGLMDNKQCYLVNCSSARKTEIWNEAGEVIGTLKYVPHKHPLAVYDMTVSHRGTFIVTHSCNTGYSDDCRTVTEYAPDGSFIRHLLTLEDGVHWNSRVSCDQQGYLWITDTYLLNYTVYIYKLI